MLWVRRIWVWLRTAFHHERAVQRLDDEFQFHLEQQIAENVAKGMNQEDARHAALRCFGNPMLLKDQARDTWRCNLLEWIGKDFHHAARSLRNSPLFTLMVVLSLALGIGANTAIFTLLYAALWKPLAVEKPQEIFQLLRIASTGDFVGESSYSYVLFQHLREVANPWTEIFATETPGPRKFGLNTESTERIAGEAVSANFFSVLRITPKLGRVLESRDDSVLGGNHVAVLSYAFWVRRFRSNPSVVGKTIYYEETPYTVVGVAQPGFSGIEAELAVEVWIPVTSSVEDKAWLTSPGVNWLKLVARLRPDARPAVQSLIESTFRRYVTDTLLPRASGEYKQSLESQRVTLRPAGSGLASMGREYEKPLLVLFAIVALVLLISCANVANLIMARNGARQQEMMVRRALGATRWRIVCQLFTENLLLSLLGATFAVILANWGTHFLVTMLPQSPLPIAFDLGPGLAMLGFATTTAVITAVLFGLGPALGAAREGTGANFRSGQRIIGGFFHGRFLLAGQLALSLPLLVGAELFVDTLHNLKASDLGFHAEGVVTFDTSFPKGTPEYRMRQDFRQIKEQLESHAGVTVASYAWPDVYGLGGWSNGVEVEGHQSGVKEDNEVGMIAVGPGFFESIGLCLLQGRYLNSQDQTGKPPVAAVNESFARYYFGTNSAIGKYIELAGEPQIRREIVGVVRDARHYGVRERIWPIVYVPEWAEDGGSFLVRTSLNAQAVSGIVRAEAAEADKAMEVGRIRPLEKDVDELISRERLTATLSSASAALACLLAAIGLYGVLAYSISRRTNEFGIRIALGAQRTDIQGLVLRQTLPMILAGVGIGVAVAFGLTRALSAIISGMLFGIHPTDISLFIGATGALIAIALVAGLVPARRASQIDPIVALRHD
jgi:predicted permease